MEPTENSAKMLTQKPKAEGRPGNIALDVPRPLFEKGPNYDFTEFKANLLSTKKPSALPE